MECDDAESAGAYLRVWNNCNNLHYVVPMTELPDELAKARDKLAEANFSDYGYTNSMSAIKRRAMEIFAQGFNACYAHANEAGVQVTMERDQLRERNKRLTEALEFYAKHHHHLKTTAPNFAQEALKGEPPIWPIKI